MGKQISRHAGLGSGYGKINFMRTGLATTLLNLASDYGGAMELGYNSEEITLSVAGATTDTSATFLPANSIILGVTSRITETVTTAVSYTLGDATTAARFLASNSDVTAADTAIGTAAMEGGVATDATGPTQTAAAAMRITANATPGAGKILVTVYYLKFTAPTESPA